MKIEKYFSYDVDQGGRKELPKTLFIVLVTILVILEADKFVRTLIEFGYCESFGTFFDYVAYFFRGDYVYELSPSTNFIIPAYWLSFHVFIAYITGFYPYEDFVQYGRLSVLYGKSRISWWLAKVLWQVMLVAWCYVAVYGTIAGYIIWKGLPLNLGLTQGIWNNLSPELLEHTTVELIIIVVIVPFLTSVTITIIQGVIAFLYTPIVSFMLVNAILVVSVYSTSFLWIGNYTMWLRSRWISPDGIYPAVAVGVDGILIVVFLIMGIERFRKTDFIEKENIF